MGKPNYTIESIINDCENEKYGIEKSIYEYLVDIKNNDKVLYKKLAAAIKSQDFDDIGDIAIYLRLL